MAKKLRLSSEHLEIAINDNLCKANGGFGVNNIPEAMYGLDPINVHNEDVIYSHYLGNRYRDLRVEPLIIHPHEGQLFMNAISHGNLEEAKSVFTPKDKLLDYDSRGYTALHYAARNGKLDCITYLLEEGFPGLEHPDLEGNTPLLLASFAYNDDLPDDQRDNYYKILEYLIAHGANVNVQNYDRVSPLHIALSWKKRNLKVLKTLINKTEDMNLKDKRGNNFLHILIKSLRSRTYPTHSEESLEKSQSFESGKELMEILLSNGVSLEEKNDSQENMTMLAIWNNLPSDMVLRLMPTPVSKAREAVTEMNYCGKNVFSVACEKLINYFEIIEYCLDEIKIDSNIIINSHIEKYMPFHSLCVQNSMQSVSILKKMLESLDVEKLKQCSFDKESVKTLPSQDGYSSISIMRSVTLTEPFFYHFRHHGRSPFINAIIHRSWNSLKVLLNSNLDPNDFNIVIHCALHYHTEHYDFQPKQCHKWLPYYYMNPLTFFLSNIATFLIPFKEMSKVKLDQYNNAIRDTRNMYTNSIDGFQEPISIGETKDSIMEIFELLMENCSVNKIRKHSVSPLMALYMNIDFKHEKREKEIVSVIETIIQKLIQNGATISEEDAVNMAFCDKNHITFIFMKYELISPFKFLNSKFAYKLRAFYAEQIDFDKTMVAVLILKCAMLLRSKGAMENALKIAHMLEAMDGVLKNEVKLKDKIIENCCHQEVPTLFNTAQSTVTTILFQSGSFFRSLQKLNWQVKDFIPLNDFIEHDISVILEEIYMISKEFYNFYPQTNHTLNDDNVSDDDDI